MSEDTRPLLVFIWWPIALVAISGGVIMLIGALSGATFTTHPLPVIIIVVIALGGLALVPVLVRSSRAQFRGRGFRGFWRAFRKTEWGEGVDTSV